MGEYHDTVARSGRGERAVQAERRDDDLAGFGAHLDRPSG